MIAHKQRGRRRQTEHDDETQRAVVEDRVEQHQQQTDESGAEAGDERL